MAPRRTHGRGGFTLAEVLVSLVLVGVILPVAMGGITLAMGLCDDARHRTEAATLARGKLAEVMATGEWQSSQTEGGFGDAWPDYSWQIDVTPWQEPECSQVTFTVRWIARGKEDAASLTTLAYAWSE
jgi:prepilin-type N-terminal cleavage/methylation domain-containing protein